MARTLYEVLGVSPGAETDEVRRAYHRLARALHPDRLDGRPAADIDRAARRMQEINEAWRVLRNTETRAAYDRTVLPTAGRSSRRSRIVDDMVDMDLSTPGTTSTQDGPDLDRPVDVPMAEPGDLGLSIVRALPWIVLVVILAAIFVSTAFAGGGDDDVSSDLVGSCVSSAGGGLSAVPCSGPNDGEVVAVVSDASVCLKGTSARAGEDGWLCLRSVEDDDPSRP